MAKRTDRTAVDLRIDAQSLHNLLQRETAQFLCSLPFWVSVVVKGIAKVPCSPTLIAKGLLYKRVSGEARYRNDRAGKERIVEDMPALLAALSVLI